MRFLPRSARPFLRPLAWLLVFALSPCAALLASAAPAPAASVLPFPPASGQTDLQIDPAFVLGELPNGLRYALRANSEPRGRVSLRLVVAAGSLHETDDQRGLAHFLEHLAFNGSTHYPPGTLIEFFQRMGMNFGGHTNAYTSFDRTVYMLELPDTRHETLAEGLRVLGDYAGGLLLEPAEIERERGVILAEKLARDSADYRAAIAGYEFFFGHTRLPARIPIGDETVIKTADRPRFLDYYDTWYRPSRLAVIAVGDFDPAVVEKQLRDALAPLADRAPARPAPAFHGPVDPAAPAFGHHHEPEASATSITLQVVRPPDLAPDTAARRAGELPLELAFAMLNRRLAELAKAEDAPFVRAAAGRDRFPAVFDGVELGLVARPGQWAASLRTGENELRRALDHGFLAGELREAVADYRNALEQAVKTAPTRRSEDHANTLVSAFLDGDIPTTPAADLALLGPALERLTPEDCHRALRAAWGDPAERRVAVVGNTALGDGTPESARAAIAAAFSEASSVAVAPPAERTDAPWAYADFGPAGEVASRVEIADLGVTQVVFANGVRLNLKRTDFEAGVVGVRARVGVGQLTEPSDQPGLAFFGGAAFTAGGLGKHSADELRRILAGRNVGVGFNVADDALALSGQTTPADLALQLQLLAAHIQDPGFRAEGELVARRQLEPFYARLLTQPNGPLNLEAQRLLASGDTRFGMPQKAEVFARTLAELRAWLAPQLASGPIELSLVGDFDPEAAISAAASTLGALPAREAKPALVEQRRVAIAPAGAHALTYAGAIEKNLLAIYWPTADARDVRRARRLALLGEVLGDRLRKTVREELGGSYSPDAYSAPSDTYHDFGFIIAQVTLDPAELDRVRSAVLEAAADLAKNGVTDDELNRARLPLLTSLRESERRNAYWLNQVLASSQEQPLRLDWARSRYADFESITKAELDALAAAYLDPARSIRFTITPAAK
ncbi:MAG: insulinase family protein [Opitutaceae bacterium]|nr:insulinase family protein [Opitutaceae bacterium]